MHFFLRIRLILTPAISALAKFCPSPVSPSWKKIQTRIDFHITDSKRNVHYPSFKIYRCCFYPRRETTALYASRLPNWTLRFSFSRWNMCALWKQSWLKTCATTLRWETSSQTGNRRSLTIVQLSQTIDIAYLDLLLPRLSFGAVRFLVWDLNS